MIRNIINSVLLTISLPIIGYIIDCINNMLMKASVRTFGVFITNLLFNWISFVGVIHHELSHALFAIITGAKVTKIELFKPNGYSLGSVSFIPRGNLMMRSIQNSVSAVGPVLLGCITEYVIYKFILPNTRVGWQKGIILYLMISIFLHMTMSLPDIKCWLKGVPVCFIITFILVIIFKIDIFTVINK